MTVLLYIPASYSQCPIGTFELRSQSEVNAFIETYADCPTIKGNLILRGNDITDISGLSFLTSITGNLNIESNINLTSLNGLQNISNIGNNLYIYKMKALTDLSGLNGNAIQQLNGFLEINNNDALQNIDALNGIQSVRRYVNISDNPALISIEGLAKIIKIDNNLTISNNESLTTLKGVEDIQIIVDRIQITNNDILNDCSAICAIIQADGVKNVVIYNNPIGCNNQTEVEATCSPSVCDIGTIRIDTQRELTTFISNYTTCDTLRGNLRISGTVENLIGLSFIKVLYGNISIINNQKLVNIVGFNKVKILGSLTIDDNRQLNSLEGIEQIEIGSDLIIEYNEELLHLNELSILTNINGDLTIKNNSNLDNYVGLSNLTNIRRNFTLFSNNAVFNLIGIEQLQSVGGDLNIQYNQALSDCGALCTLFDRNIPDGDININRNSSQCSSLQEIELYCANGTCPEGNIQLTTQAEVNTFVASYTDCDSLSGNLTIKGYNNITDLSGLSFLTHITGNLRIEDNFIITDLSGFENLKKIGGYLLIEENAKLVSIDKLGQLISLGSNLEIKKNSALANLIGIEQLTTIEGNLHIEDNTRLSDLNALDSLTTINGDFRIHNNQIRNLSGLFQLQLVQGTLTISNNSFLRDCSGICPIINNNGVQGDVSITRNPSECSSPTEVSLFCLTMDCPSGDISLSNQIDVDAFVANSAKCDSLFGSLYISGSRITDLSGLSFLTYIQGSLHLIDNYSLPSLAGFENLQGVGGDFIIDDQRSIKNLTALSQLTHVNGSFTISNNDSLTTLNELSLLTTIRKDLTISYNERLTDCRAICEVIVDGGVNDNISIYGNPSKCSNLAEVTTLCIESDCPFGDVSLSSQNEVNTFISTFSDCDSLLGSLYISGNDITDLSNLSFLTYVQGTLHLIDNYSLPSLAGFENLRGVGKDFTIKEQRSIKHLEALSRLTHIGGSFTITSNDSLATLEGLNLLTTIGKDLTVSDNSSLTNCGAICNLINDGGVEKNTSITGNPSECSSPAEITILCTENDCPIGNVILSSQNEVNAFVKKFSNCDTIRGDLRISGESFGRNGSNITDLSGLSFIEHVQGNFYLLSNNKLSSLAGFENLKEVGGTFFIGKNRSLKNIEELNQLVHVGESFHIYSNDSLTTLNGLNQLISIKKNLRIIGNSTLTDCSDICNIINNNGVADEIFIFANPSECSSLPEVLVACNSEDPCTTNPSSVDFDISIVGNTVTLTVDTSHAPNITNYIWTYGDGASGSGITPYNNYTYASAGTYAITLETMGDCDTPPIAKEVTIERIDCTDFSLTIEEIENTCANITYRAQLKNGIPPFQYHWTTDSTNTDSFFIADIETHIGNQLLKVTDAIGCESSQIFTVTPSTPLAAIFTYELTADSILLANQSIGNIKETQWTFNTPQAIRNNRIPLPPVGNYHICLLVTNECDLQNVSCQTISIKEPSPICPDGSVVLNSDAEILAFVRTYPNCTEIAGDLLIRSNLVNSFAPLTQLTAIGGTLFLDNTLSPNLIGFENITTVGNLTININNSLKDLSGFTQLASIKERVIIIGNNRLERINGLNNLTSTTTELVFYDNPALTIIDGFANLSSIEMLDIHKNPILTDITRIGQLDALGISIQIKDNPLLKTCNVPSICQYLTTDKSAIIANNAPACNSIETVIKFCKEPLLDNIFVDYPVLLNFVSPTTCTDETITVYKSGAYTYFYIETATSGQLYNIAGRAYCTTGLGLICTEAYAITELLATYTCPNKPTILDNDQDAVLSDIDPDDSDPCVPNTINIACTSIDTLSIFTVYPFLYDLIDVTNCTNEKITTYLFNGYPYIFIESDNSSILYNENGTRYCTDGQDLICTEAYTVDEILKEWSCGDTVPLRPIDQDQDGTYTDIDPDDEDPCIPNSSAANCEPTICGEIEWSNNFGGSSDEEIITIKETPDGGSIFFGITTSPEKIIGNSPSSWLVKLDASGNLQWEKSYNLVVGIDMQLTPDNGYIITGFNPSNSIQNVQIEVIKLDQNGNIQWDNQYGNNSIEIPIAIDVTSDGGYILTGYTNGVADEFGGPTSFLLKLDANGLVQWEDHYTIQSTDVEQTEDGGYILIGWIQTNESARNLSILKTDEVGLLQWQHYYGGSKNDSGDEIHQTKDGGFIAIGESSSSDGDIKSNLGLNDIWVLKLDPIGSLEWEKNIGTNSTDFAGAIKETANGDFIVVGSSQPNDGELFFHTSDYLATKLSATGEIIWERRFDIESGQTAQDIVELSTGGYLIAGESRAFSTDNKRDAWIVKFICEMDELPISLDYNRTEVAIIKKTNVSLKKYFKIYPNPNRGQFYIDLSTFSLLPEKVVVKNTRGQMIFSKKVSNSIIELNLKRQAAGVYFVQVQSSERLITKRFVIN